MPDHSPDTRLVVQAVDGLDPAGLASVGPGLQAVAVPAIRTDPAPRAADGVPERLALDSGDVSMVLPTELAEARGFSAAVGETLVVANGAGPAVVFVGCGVPARLSVDALRRVGAAAFRSAGTSGTALFILPAGLVDALGAVAPGTSGDTGPRRAAQAVSEGAALAAYRFTAYKTESGRDRVDTFVIAGAGIEPGIVAEGVRRGSVVADAVCFARDLVNEPPSSMTPMRLADAVAARLSGRGGLAMEIWDEDRIAAERLGGLLGVARGSAEPPRLLRAVYEPPDPVEVDGAVPHVVLVGKGITFDSGGLSLKTPEGMTTMKTDMSGAAAVLAAVSACGDLGVRVRVTAIAPVTENMPGGRATKPGDVLTIRNGKTIEVLNTDAEGRLVLADALSLASELAPDAIVDLATLTGACVMALGRSIAGLFGNDDDLLTRVQDASERAGEPSWPLPLPERYRGDIDSDVADMRNIGKAGQAGAIAAAMLLERFVGETPWAHLDIAGPARSDEEDGVLTKGGTGFGVRTLLELVEHLAAS